MVAQRAGAPKVVRARSRQQKTSGSADARLFDGSLKDPVTLESSSVSGRDRRQMGHPEIEQDRPIIFRRCAQLRVGAQESKE